MFALKKNYFFIIESIKDISLENIKIRNKFSIIYRNQKIIENKSDLLSFRKKCKLKAIKFFVANDINLAFLLNADGLYLSAFNKSLRFLAAKRSTFEIIGSAHNLREITMKIRQGCKLILLSKLFLVSYDKKSNYLGLVKFNNFLKFYKNLVPLGGINVRNLNSLKNINSTGFALMSEIKKKAG